MLSGIIHGENCEKKDHDNDEWVPSCGWKHDPNYDGPYSLGHFWACGRCHAMLTPEQVCEMLKRSTTPKEKTQTATEPERWEYKCTTLSGWDVLDADKGELPTLLKAGMDGWEMVTILEKGTTSIYGVSHDFQRTYYFKRRMAVEDPRT